MAFFQFFSRPAMFLCLTLIPFLIGKGALQVLGGKRGRRDYAADAVVTGWILCIGTAEAVHLAAVFLGRPFSDAVKLLASAYAVLCLAALGVLLRARLKERGDRAARRERKRRQLRRRMDYRPITVFEALLILSFLLLTVYQLVTITSGDRVSRAGDLTVETVESFLGTDSLYSVNPLTGRAYEAGIPLRLKILCLPTIYGFLSRVFGVAGAEVVWEIVPVVTLLGYDLVFYVLAESFFPGADGRGKRMLFMLFAAVLVCEGDYMYGMDGFGLLYSGFRGVTIRNAVLLPYVFGLALRDRWRNMVLCVLAEACIVWTLYGMGACLLAALLLLAARKLSGEIERRRNVSGEGARTGWNC